MLHAVQLGYERTPTHIEDVGSVDDCPGPKDTLCKPTHLLVPLDRHFRQPGGKKTDHLNAEECIDNPVREACLDLSLITGRKSQFENLLGGPCQVRASHRSESLYRPSLDRYIEHHLRASINLFGREIARSVAINSSGLPSYSLGTVLPLQFTVAYYKPVPL